MQKFLILYLLFHHNLMIFLWGFRVCLILFISASVIGIIFMLGKLLNFLELR